MSDLIKPWWSLGFGLLGGLLAAGLLWLIASPPRGETIQLAPAPTPAPIWIHVQGPVANPGLYSLPPGSRLDDALAAAGGLLPEADPQSLNLAMRLEDGSQIQVPALPAMTGGSPSAPTRPPAAAVSGPATAQPAAEIQININRASAAELESLPGIGPATAGKIIQYREKNGPFLVPEDLLKVSGIGPATYERIEESITVE